MTLSLNQIKSLSFVNGFLMWKEDDKIQTLRICNERQYYNYGLCELCDEFTGTVNLQQDSCTSCD
jgi:hypothetical protein